MVGVLSSMMIPATVIWRVASEQIHIIIVRPDIVFHLAMAKMRGISAGIPSFARSFSTRRVLLFSSLQSGLGCPSVAYRFITIRDKYVTVSAYLMYKIIRGLPCD